MTQSARSELVLALQRWRWLLHLGYGRDLVLFVAFVLIELSQALITACVARFLDCSGSIFLWVLYWFYFVGFILFIVLRGIGHSAYLQLLACKEPAGDGIKAQ
jgi:hypothetical protein